MAADIAAVAAAVGAALRDAGLPVSPEQCQRFAQAVTLLHPIPPAGPPAAERESRETGHGETRRGHGPGRARAAAEAVSAPELRACALATLVTDPEQIEVLDRVFAALFGTAPPPAGVTGQPGDPPQEQRSFPQQPHPQQGEQGQAPGQAGQAPRQPPECPPREQGQAPGQPPECPPGQPGQAPGQPPGQPPPGQPGPQRPSLPQGFAQRSSPQQPDPPGSPDRAPEFRMLASAAERLGSRDFAELSADELAQLEALMRQLTVATPLRRTRRRRRAPAGDRADLRATLRQARRTHGEPLVWARTAARPRPRRLVVLCDISGSMEPYARAMLQLLYCVTRAGRIGGVGAGGQVAGVGAGGRTVRAGTQAEVFTFATRLTRITPDLNAASFAAVLDRAGRAAPDWSGGTRIGAAVKEFNDSYGCRGMARGAVVLIISDGWETGDPALLHDQMGRLSRVAYRIVWANPRTKSPRYRPAVSGMAAAWPYCDAVVSAHSLDALDDLIAAVRAG